MITQQPIVLLHTTAKKVCETIQTESFCPRKRL